MRIVFQQVDTDVYVGFPMNIDANDREQRDARPIIRIYGVTRDGVSVLVHVHGYCPYFYVKAWHGFEKGDETKLQASLDVKSY